jgi:hypothetical protein
MAPKHSKTLSALLEKIEWLRSKPVLGALERIRLEKMAARIKVALEPESPETIIGDATTLINMVATAEPLRQAMGD